MEAEMMWHKDGHSIDFILDKSNLIIAGIHCPSEDGKCRNRHGLCVFKLFVDVFGLDCNVGSCPATSPITLCWTNVGDFEDIELMQIWVIPRNDDVFGSWLQIQNR